MSLRRGVVDVGAGWVRKTVGEFGLGQDEMRRLFVELYLESVGILRIEKKCDVCCYEFAKMLNLF